MHVRLAHKRVKLYGVVAGFVLLAVVTALIYAPHEAEGWTVYPSVFDDAELFLVASQYSGSGDWLDQSGNGHDGVITGALFKDYSGTKYVYLPGIAGNDMTTPDHADFNVTDFFVGAYVSLDDWTPTGNATIAAQWLSAGNQRAWKFNVGSAGKLQFIGSEDGTAVLTTRVSDSGVGYTDGTRHWIGVSIDVNAGAGGVGQVTFYEGGTAATPSWSTFGGTVDIADGSAPFSMHNSTSVLETGSEQGGTATLWAGDVYRMVMYNTATATGSPILDIDLNDSTVAEPFATFTSADSTGHTVTINRSGSTNYVSTVVDQDMFLFDGSDDLIDAADHDDLDFDTTDDLTLLFVGRVDDVTSAFHTLVGKAWRLMPATANEGYGLSIKNDNFIQAEVDDGTNEVIDTFANPAVHTRFIAVVRRDATANEVEAALDGTLSGSPTTDDTTATNANAQPFRIGARAAGETYMQGQVMAVALWRRALSDAEIASIDISQLTRGGPSPRNLASVDAVIHTSPDTNVGIVRDGQSVADGGTGHSGIFRNTVFADQGNIELQITATDELGLVSEQLVPFFARWGSRMSMPAIVMPPTISYEVDEDGIRLYGNAYPESIVTLVKNDARSSFVVVKAHKDGSWEYMFDADEIDMTEDSIQAYVEVKGLITSPLSELIVFDGESDDGDTESGDEGAEDHQLTLAEIQAKIEEITLKVISLKVDALTERVKELTKLMFGV